MIAAKEHIFAIILPTNSLLHVRRSIQFYGLPVLSSLLVRIKRTILSVAFQRQLQPAKPQRYDSWSILAGPSGGSARGIIPPVAGDLRIVIGLASGSSLFSRSGNDRLRLFRIFGHHWQAGLQSMDGGAVGLKELRRSCRSASSAKPMLYRKKKTSRYWLTGACARRHVGYIGKPRCLCAKTDGISSSLLQCCEPSWIL